MSKRPWRVRVLSANGTPVYVHVTVVAAFPLAWLWSGGMLAGSIGLMAFLLLMLAHELGHAYVARLHGLEVLSIDLFPVHGRCMYEAPPSRAVEVAVSWGGIAGQAVVFVVAVGLAEVLAMGEQSVPAVLSTAFFVWIPMNILIALSNLIPLKGLDGAIAWGVIPLIRQRLLGSASHARASHRQAQQAGDVVKDMLHRITTEKPPEG